MSCKNDFCKTAKSLSEISGNPVTSINNLDDVNLIVQEWDEEKQDEVATTSTDATILNALAASPLTSARAKFYIARNKAAKYSTLALIGREAHYGVSPTRRDSMLDLSKTWTKEGVDISAMLIYALDDPEMANVFILSERTPQLSLMALAKVGHTHAVTNPQIANKNIAELYNFYGSHPDAEIGENGREAILQLPRERLDDELLERVFDECKQTQNIDTVTQLAGVDDLPEHILEGLSKEAAINELMPNNLRVAKSLAQRSDLTDKQRARLRHHTSLETLVWSNPDMASENDIRAWRRIETDADGIEMDGRMFTPVQQSEIKLGVLKNPNTPISIRNELLEESSFSVPAMRAVYDCRDLDESTMVLMVENLHRTELAYGVLSHGEPSQKAMKVVANRIFLDEARDVAVKPIAYNVFDQIDDPQLISRVIEGSSHKAKLRLAANGNLSPKNIEDLFGDPRLHHVLAKRSDLNKSQRTTVQKSSNLFVRFAAIGNNQITKGELLEMKAVEFDNDLIGAINDRLQDIEDGGG